MSSSDPFDLVKTKKWPSITGQPQQYAKDHRDWIKRLVEEVISLKGVIDSLKTECSKKQTKIDQLVKINDDQKVTISELSERIESLTTSSKDLTALVNSIKSDVEKMTPLQANLEGNIKQVVEDAAKNITLAEVLKRGLDTKNSDFEVNLALANNKEAREKKIRAKNIIIFGLNSVSDKQRDEQQVYDLFNVLNVSNEKVKRITRIATKASNEASRPPPVIVEFDSSTTKDSVLKSTGALKGLDRFNGVQVAPDLTPSERIGLKLERETCVVLNDKLPVDSPFVWRVRGGVRRKVDKETKRLYRANRTENDGSSA